jgi:hypothetical protein
MLIDSHSKFAQGLEDIKRRFRKHHPTISEMIDQLCDSEGFSWASFTKDNAI